MKAIETVYQGYRFRSRLEARWAVFLDAMKEPWEYEREGFSLKSGCYLPDFWLPRLGCWLEIKGEEPMAEELRLCEELAWFTDRPVAIAWGLPFAATGRRGEVYGERLRVFCGDDTDSSAGTGWWNECYWAWRSDQWLCISSANTMRSRSFLSPSLHNGFPGMKQDQETTAPIPACITDAAKRARFEHGG